MVCDNKLLCLEFPYREKESCVPPIGERTSKSKYGATKARARKYFDDVEDEIRNSDLWFRTVEAIALPTEPPSLPLY